MKKIRKMSKRAVYIEIPFQVGPGLLFNRSASSQHINYFTPVSIFNFLVASGFSIIKMEFDKSGYRYNGMPGMIRVIAEKDDEILKNKKNGFLSSLYYLLSPLIFVNSKFIK
jgi:hypothetical protein